MEFLTTHYLQSSCEIVESTTRGVTKGLLIEATPHSTLELECQLGEFPPSYRRG